jgi:hypothetical protein
MWVEATGDGRFARIRPMGHGLDATVTVVCSRVTVASVVVAARFSVGDGTPYWLLRRCSPNPSGEYAS